MKLLLSVLIVLLIVSSVSFVAADGSSTDASSYKRMKEQWVSGLKGTSIIELAWISMTPNLIVAFRSIVLPCLNRLSVSVSSPVSQFLLDFLTVGIPMVIAITFTEISIVIIILMAAFAVFILKRVEKLDRQALPNILSFGHEAGLKSLQASRKPFVSTFRASLMLLTSIAILAVDFSIFPRRFAKTETFGYSLMDAGVGSFVVSMAIVARGARPSSSSSTPSSSSSSSSSNPSSSSTERSKSPLLSSRSPVGTTRGSESRLRRSNSAPLSVNTNVSNAKPTGPASPTTLSNMDVSALASNAPRRFHTQVEQTRIGLIRAALPTFGKLLLLGLIRLATTKGIEYQEHVSEYGVHWNFFFTLATLSIVPAAINVPAKYSGHLGLIILVCHQTALSLFGWQEYILEHPRDSFFAQNREGFLSSIGYVGLYLVGVHIGHLIMKRKSSIGWQEFFQTMLKSTGVFWIATIVSHFTIGPASRRMVNLTYAMLILALTTQSLTFFLGLQLCTSPVSSPLLESINENLLAFFLVANLGTGLTNLAIKTLMTPPLTAFLIMLLYTLIITLTAFFWKQMKVKVI